MKVVPVFEVRLLSYFKFQIMTMLVDLLRPKCFEDYCNVNTLTVGLFPVSSERSQL